MTQRRTFTAEFKTQVVLDLVTVSAASTQPASVGPLEDRISRTRTTRL